MITKRVFDAIASFILLLLFSPLLLILAVVSWLHLGFPILYRQLRPGIRGIPFTIYKFRTMMDRVDEKGNPLPDSQRLTNWGRFLRSTSMDELPELWNVLRGDMSLVGPRPLLMQYLTRYTPEQFRRHEVLPGITGWAQIHGRNALSWDERFRLDVWYVENRSFWLDIRILLLTILKIIKKEGVAANGHVTMPEFLGSEKSSRMKHED